MGKPKITLAERSRALNPRIRVGNYTATWTKARRTYYGPLLDGKYWGKPRCRTYEGALLKAEKLAAKIAEVEANAVSNEWASRPNTNTKHVMKARGRIDGHIHQRGNGVGAFHFRPTRSVAR